MTHTQLIDRAIVRAIRTNRELISEAQVSLEPGDSIYGLEIRLPDGSRLLPIPEVLVEQRHIDLADAAEVK